MLDRRELLMASGAAAVSGSAALRPTLLTARPSNPFTVSVKQFGGRDGSGQDDTHAVKAAIAAVEQNGGGTIIVAGRYRCGNAVIAGHDVRLQGEAGWLIDGRLTIAPEARNIEISDLGLLDTTADRRTFLMDISGLDCRFTNVRLIKHPIAGGYQMYLRQQSATCVFDGLRLKGSNGIMVSGSGHRFQNFEFESTMSTRIGGDDAFAIKAVEDTTENILIRRGRVRGYSAIASFGSEIGSPEGRDRGGIVRNVVVEDVVADRCTSIAFFKPDALDYDWRNGLVEKVVLRNLSLSDPKGDYFRSGIRMIAARGAVIRDVRASGIRISARAKDRRVAPTAAIDLTLLDIDGAARIEDVNLQLSFVDPYGGARHGPKAPGYPVDHIVRIEKLNQQSGAMSEIVLDVQGRGAGWGGIYVGPGLDDAVRVERATLVRVATDPPAATGGGGIWSDSRLSLGRISIESVKLPRFGGTAFPRTR